MSSILTTNVDQRLLRTTKFPIEFNTKVDMQKVNVPVIKKWAADKIAKILNDDDDVVPELVFNMLESSRYPKIKDLQIALSGFLDKDAPSFCLQLWKLCISAEQSPQGVPKELLEAKKQELERERIQEEQAREAASRRMQAERERERNVDDMRRADRAARTERRGPSHRERSPDRSRRDRTPPARRRRSPSPRYRREDRRPPQEIDRYMPDKSPRSNGHRRKRSLSSSDRSRSRTRARRTDEADTRGDSRDRHRSPPKRRRSRSPRREKHANPPPRRRRNSSSSILSSESDKHHARPRSRDGRRKRSRSRSAELLSDTQRGLTSHRRDTRRLSRSPSDAATSGASE